jgi:protein-glutamine gamma-glutamyltransferase
MGVNMLNISGNAVDQENFDDKYPSHSIERIIVKMMASSSMVFNYQTPEELEFELKLRKSIITASIDLYKSRLAFETFRDSRCNADFWLRTDEGGFELKKDVKPLDAIMDIFHRTSRYGTECATAIVIIYYKSLLDTFPEELFNRLFSEIYLMNWQHLDSDLGITDYSGIKDLLPGDCRYFINPDVNPLTPEWQGENTIYLSDGYFYGHGIGIEDSAGMINVLNKRRIMGSNVSAYLMDFAQHPDFKNLADIYDKPTQRLMFMRYL